MVNFDGLNQFEVDHLENFDSLLRVCNLIHTQMKKNPNSKIILQCPVVPEYAGLIISSYLQYKGMKDCMGALIKCNSIIDKSPVFPSIQRYAKYINLLFIMPLPSVNPLELVSITIKGIPSNLKIPIFIIKQDGETKHRTVSKPFVTNSCLVYENIDCYLLGDFQIECFAGVAGKKIFRYAQNTMMINTNHMTSITRSQMDYAYKEEELKKFEVFLTFKKKNIDKKSLSYEEHIHNLINLSPSNINHDLFSKKFRLNHVKEEKHLNLMEKLKDELEKAIFSRKLKSIKTDYERIEAPSSPIMKSPRITENVFQKSRRLSKICNPLEDKKITKDDIKRWKRELDKIFLEANERKEKKKSESKTTTPMIPSIEVSSIDQLTPDNIVIPIAPPMGPFTMPNIPLPPMIPKAPSAPKLPELKLDLNKIDLGVKKLHWDVIPANKTKETVISIQFNMFRFGEILKLNHLMILIKIN